MMTPAFAGVTTSAYAGMTNARDQTRLRQRKQTFFHWGEQMKNYYVYLLASKKRGVLYIGVTNNLRRRVTEHKEKINPGFTKRYNVDKLVYFDSFTSIVNAIKYEKQMKKWLRRWKIELIEKTNPEWKDLFFDL
jgi:putative endonuclease